MTVLSRVSQKICYVENLFYVRILTNLLSKCVGHFIFMLHSTKYMYIQCLMGISVVSYVYGGGCIIQRQYKMQMVGNVSYWLSNAGGADSASQTVLRCILQAVLLLISNKVGKGAKIRNRYNQVPHLTQDTNGKVKNSQDNV